MKDYYALLGIGREATADQIKSAYRKQAMAFHPDRNGGSNASEERLKEINRAYEVLGDEAQRRRYDPLWGRHGKNTAPGQQREEAPPFSAGVFWRVVHQGFSARDMRRCKRRGFMKGGCAKRAWPM
ncbi:MAG: DnaJ domain-containing protein [Thermodesulfobacteriota bacterium]|nr:DnaJ domain-containing protein [Thermodesulfobacteriota bacterium]